MTGTAADPLKAGDHRKALEALRDLLADSIRSCDPNVVPQVAARLQSVLTELAALPAPTSGGVVHKLQGERAKRRSA